MHEVEKTNTIKKLIIIPAFNEADSLCTLVREIERVSPDYDYIIINDGSSDDTVKVCEQNGLNVITLPVNLGIGGAMQTGYLYAKQRQYDIAIQLDGDGQHDPAYLDTLIEPVISGQADFCIGSRFIDKKGFQSTVMRRSGIMFLVFFIKLVSGMEVLDATSGFRAANKDVINAFCEYYPYDYPEPETICVLLKKGYKVKEIPVQMRERSAGVSSIRFLKSAYYMVKVTLAILISGIRK